MNSIIKKIHMYMGLLNFSILVVFGTAGLTATFQPRPESRAKPEPTVRFESFTVPSGLDDKEVADRVHTLLKIPLSTPVPKFALHRDRENNLAFDFYTINAVHTVTVLEKEARLRIEKVGFSIWRYLDHLHSTTINATQADWRITLWKYYNEFAIWSLIGMAISGSYLGLTSRPGYKPARYALVVGCGVFIMLYLLTR